MRARAFVAGVVVAAGLSCSACTFDGVNSVPLPGNTASGSTFRVTVELADVQNLVGNSPVKSQNVTVGNIRRIETSGFHAEVTLDINSDADVPRNVVAKLAQTSLFGSQYLELELPDGRQPVGRLSEGAHLGLKDSSSYPEVEEVLSSLALVLNGSSLQQLRTISFELDRVLAGRAGTARDLIGRLDTVVGSLADQRDKISQAVDSLGELSTTLSRQKAVIADGIDSLAPAIDLVNRQKGQLVSALQSVGEFGDAATQVLTSSHDNLVADLENLAPTVNKLADAGDDLVESLKIALTLPFPVMATDRGIRGDYLNLFLTLDISPGKLASATLPSVVTRGKSTKPDLARGSADPLTGPLKVGRQGRR